MTEERLQNQQNVVDEMPKQSLQKEPGSPEKMPGQTGKKRQLRPWQGLLFFVLVMLVMYFVCSWMQYYWGMAGLAATELLLLCMAVLYVWILKADFKEVFPFRKLEAAPFFGTILVWIGGYLLIMVVSAVLMYLFPDAYFAVSEGLEEFMADTNPLAEFFITAFMAAVCEEAVTRGVIQTSFYPIKSKWAVILLVAVIFGIFHMDPIRFLPTVLLGGMMAYVVYETRNLFYGMLFHFVNNGFISIVSLFQTRSTDAGIALLKEQPALMLISIGSYMMMACVAPFLMYTAAYLVRMGNARGEKVTYFPKKRKGLVLGLLIAATAILLVGGFCLMMGAILLQLESMMEILVS